MNADVELIDFCERLHPKLVRVLRAHCGDEGLAEDLAQEALVRAWERWAQVARMEYPEAWAFRVALNMARSRFRRLGVEARALARLARDDRTGAEARDDLELVEIRDAIARLPKRQRAALTVRFLADLSVEESAVALACAPGTVKALTSQGIANLRRFSVGFTSTAAATRGGRGA